MQHPGIPKSSVHAPNTSHPTSHPDGDIANVTLALQTLGSFNFGGMYVSRSFYRVEMSIKMLIFCGIGLHYGNLPCKINDMF